MAKILMVDDDSAILQMLNKVFKEKSHDVTLAANGKQALAFLKKEVFDLVITDIIMPEVDGLELIMAISKMDHRPGIIAMSGGSQWFNTDLLLDSADALNADMVIPKPFGIRQIRDAVETLLSSRKKSSIFSACPKPGQVRENCKRPTPP